jgi:hypothetical protein
MFSLFLLSGFAFIVFKFSSSSTRITTSDENNYVFDNVNTSEKFASGTYTDSNNVEWIFAKDSVAGTLLVQEYSPSLNLLTPGVYNQNNDPIYVWQNFSDYYGSDFWSEYFSYCCIYIQSFFKIYKTQLTISPTIQT